MAGTFYKYAEREADSYINWAEIGKNMSDMLANENKVREEKKAAIDQSSREFGEILSNAPQGESKLMNEWALKYAGDAQSARLMQDKLLKSGQLKLNDYLVMRQNVTDGTSSAFKLSTEYQEEFKTKWDRMKQDQSQDLEQFLMAEAEGFGNFNQTQLYINPTDGKVNVAYKERGADGVYRMSSNPSKFTDINSLRNRIKGQFDKYDVNTNMESFVAGLGQELNSLQAVRASLGSTGLLSETLDITKRKNLPKDLQGVVMKFEEAETKALRAQLANAYNTSSILTNSVDICPTNNKPYTYTWDSKDAAANPEKILLINKSDGSPVPKFSEEQENVALEHLRLQARLRYDKKEELKVTQQIQLQERRPPSQIEVDEKDKEDEALNFARQTSFLISGDDAQVDGALNYFRGRGANIEKNPPGKPKGIYIQNENGEIVPFKPEGKTTDLGTSMVGSLLKATGSKLNDTKVVKYFPKYMKSGFNLTASGTGKVQERDVEGEFNTKIGTQITADLFNGKKSTVTGPTIENIFADVPGVTVKYSVAGSPFNDITVTYTNSKGVKTKAELNSNESGESAKQQVTKLKKLFNSIESSAKAKAIGTEVDYSGK